MNWYLAVLRNYIGFTGRAHRREFWEFLFFNVIISSLFMNLDRFIGTSFSIPTGYDWLTLQFGCLHIAYSVLVFIPNLAVSVRRLHDVGKSGWMILIILIPIVGFIWLLILFLKDSFPGDNQYGPNPKVIVAQA